MAATLQQFSRSKVGTLTKHTKVRPVGGVSNPRSFPTVFLSILEGSSDRKVALTDGMW